MLKNVKIVSWDGPTDGGTDQSTDTVTDARNLKIRSLLIQLIPQHDNYDDRILIVEPWISNESDDEKWKWKMTWGDGSSFECCWSWYVRVILLCTIIHWLWHLHCPTPLYTAPSLTNIRRIVEVFIVINEWLGWKLYMLNRTNSWTDRKVRTGFSRNSTEYW